MGGSVVVGVEVGVVRIERVEDVGVVEFVDVIDAVVVGIERGEDGLGVDPVERAGGAVGGEVDVPDRGVDTEGEVEGLVAEGVENRTQLRYLRSQGCTEVQGFIFSGALPASEITPLLLANPYRNLATDQPNRSPADLASD